MSNLKETQQQFLNYIFNEDDTRILPKIKAGKTSKAILFSIYRNNTIENLTQALRIKFPRVLTHLKDNQFKIIAKDFIKTTPSKTNNLDNYGKNFAKYLKSKNEIFLADIARVEWLLHQSYLAKNDLILDITKFNKIIDTKAENICFRLKPHCFLMQSFFNLHSKYKLSKPNKICNFYLITRQNLQPNFIKISKTEFNFLSAISKGNSLIEMHNKKISHIDKYLAKHVNKTIVLSLKNLADKV